MADISWPLCTDCGSTGRIDPLRIEPCPTCNGEGRVKPRDLKAERRSLTRDLYSLEQKERKGTLTEEETVTLTTTRQALDKINAALDAAAIQAP